MEQEIYTILRYNLVIGDVNLNELVYRLKELRDYLMLIEYKRRACYYRDRWDRRYPHLFSGEDVMLTLNGKYL